MTSTDGSYRRVPTPYSRPPVLPSAPTPLYAQPTAVLHEYTPTRAPPTLPPRLEPASAGTMLVQTSRHDRAVPFRHSLPVAPRTHPRTHTCACALAHKHAHVHASAPACGRTQTNTHTRTPKKRARARAHNARGRAAFDFRQVDGYGPSWLDPSAPPEYVSNPPPPPPLPECPYTSRRHCGVPLERQPSAAAAIESDPRRSLARPPELRVCACVRGFVACASCGCARAWVCCVCFLRVCACVGLLALRGTRGRWRVL